MTRFHGLIDPKITRKSQSKNKICQSTESRTEGIDLTEKCYLRSNTYFRSSSFNVLSRAKIRIGVKTENLSNDRIQNWMQRFDEKSNQILVWKQIGSFFRSSSFNASRQDRNRCHEMIDPKIDVRAPFWRTFQWSVASHPFWEFGQWNSQQSPLWLTHVTFSTNTHPSTLQASTMQYKSAPAM